MVMKIRSKDFRVREGDEVDLRKWPTDVERVYKSKQHYQELIKERVTTLLNGWTRNPLGEERSLAQYFASQASVMNRPMTSLRDVDEAGYIFFSRRDLLGARSVDDAEARRVMRFIQRGVAESEVAGD